MTFQFQEGDFVALKEDYNGFLPAGSQGVVFCRYAIEPPAYEVNFQDAEGKEFGAVMYEQEIEPVQEKAALSLRAAVQAA